MLRLDEFDDLSEEVVVRPVLLSLREGRRFHVFVLRRCSYLQMVEYVGVCFLLLSCCRFVLLCGHPVVRCRFLVGWLLDLFVVQWALLVFLSLL